LPMLGDYLQGDAWFEGTGWESGCQVSVGVSRGPA
jgi:hypothetical protein